mmetsp:Transcript_7516/g.12455  ORF Transcript_7516/g.12455 Transcript_7516/m.12455 type:complete len:90 (+) Transcript_7516:195-464(+)
MRIILSGQRRCSNISGYDRMKKNISCRSGTNYPSRSKSNRRADEAKEACYCQVKGRTEYHIYLSDTDAIVRLLLLQPNHVMLGNIMCQL